jgi:hypothetical protein
VTQQPAEYTPPGAAEQNGGWVQDRWSCSQDGDNRTQNGDARSTVL